METTGNDLAIDYCAYQKNIFRDLLELIIEFNTE
jgi:hypothetical protein